MVLTVLILYLSVIIQGGYFPTAYLPIGILSMLGLPFAAKKFPNIKTVLPFLLLCLIYFISILIIGITIDSLRYYTKILNYLIFWILLNNVKDKYKLTKAIAILGYAISILGIISYSGIIPIGGMVNVNRLQGVFQYANAMGIFTAACALTANEIEEAKYKRMPMPMEIALFLTLSAGSILFYLIGLFLAILLKFKDNRREVISSNIIRISIAFISAIIIYLLPSNLKFVSIIVLVILLLIQNKLDSLLNKAKLPLLPIVLCVGLIGTLLTIVRGGRFVGTFAERLIQISDGVMAFISNVFTGLGPGNWTIFRYAWQSLGYSAALIHSSVIQFGVDAGIASVVVVMVMFVYYFKYPIMNKPYIYTAGAIIIVHSLVDATFNFTGIVFLLLALFYIRTDEESSTKVPRWSSIAAAILILPLFIGLANWNYRFNMAIKSHDSIVLMENLENSPIKSYSGSFALADLYQKAGLSDKFKKQILKIPYKTADVYYLEAKELYAEGDFEEALCLAYLCINESKMQSYGYLLANEIIDSLPEEERIRQENVLNEYRSIALKSKHPLSYLIKNQKGVLE